MATSSPSIARGDSGIRGVAEALGAAPTVSFPASAPPSLPLPGVLPAAPSLAESREALALKEATTAPNDDILPAEDIGYSNADEMAKAAAVFTKKQFAETPVGGHGSLTAYMSRERLEAEITRRRHTNQAMASAPPAPERGGPAPAPP